MQWESIRTLTVETFVSSSVAFLKRKIESAIAARGRAVIGLSGGSTPKDIYTRLAKEDGIEWSKVWVFLVDDRYIESNHADSNQKMLNDTGQYVVPNPQLPLADAVADYAARIKYLLEHRPADCVTLGLGDDGHIASLFPPVAPEGFNEVGVIHNTTEKFAVKDRISLTLPLLESAHSAVLFLKGDGKMKVWHELVLASPNPSRWPLHPILARGHLTVIFTL